MAFPMIMLKTPGFPVSICSPNKKTTSRRRPRKSSDLVASVACSANLAAVAAKLMGWAGVRLGQDDVLWKPPGWCQNCWVLDGKRWKNATEHGDLYRGNKRKWESSKSRFNVLDMYISYVLFYVISTTFMMMY